MLNQEAIVIIKSSMKRTRIVVFFTVLIVIPAITYFVIQLARGYRPDLTTRTLKPTGLLVAQSLPDNAQILLDGKTVGATNASLNLSPGNYNVEIKKENFWPWHKRLTIEKELVTQTNSLLFPISPTAKQITPQGLLQFSISQDKSRIAYIVPKNSSITPTIPIKGASPSPSLSPDQNTNISTASGIYILELSDFPFNLNRDPKPITPTTPTTTAPDWNKAALTWSPDDRQLMARVGKDKKCLDFDRIKNPCTLTSVYLLDPSRTNSQFINIILTHKQLLKDWEAQRDLRMAQLNQTKIPKPLSDLFKLHTAKLSFSPDETKILYIATSSATIPDDVIPPVPASNSQPQERTLIPGSVYVYDLKEDRNFKLADLNVPTPTPKNTKSVKNPPKTALQDWSGIIEASNKSWSWFPTSRHIIEISGGATSVSEYDATNKVVIDSDPSTLAAVASSAGSRLFVIKKQPEGFDLLPSLYSLRLKP